MAILEMVTVAAALAKSNKDTHALADLLLQEIPVPKDYHLLWKSSQPDSLEFGERLS